MILQIILLRQQLQPLLLQLCHNLVCQTPLYSTGKRNIIHLACQYIYFPLLVLFLFAAVEQSTLSIQLVFLGADEWKQKERHARITEISTLQDLVQKGFTRINVMSSTAITIRTSQSALLCAATITYQSHIYHSGLPVTWAVRSQIGVLSFVQKQHTQAKRRHTWPQGFLWVSKHIGWVLGRKVVVSGTNCLPSAILTTPSSSQHKPAKRQACRVKDNKLEKEALRWYLSSFALQEIQLLVESQVQYDPAWELTQGNPGEEEVCIKLSSCPSVNSNFRRRSEATFLGKFMLSWPLQQLASLFGPGWARTIQRRHPAVDPRRWELCQSSGKEQPVLAPRWLPIEE